MSDAHITVRLQPRASREEIVAKRVGVAPSRMSVVRSERSRDKVLLVEGIEPGASAAALAV